MSKLKGSVDPSINRWLALPGFEKLNTWTYTSRKKVPAGDLAGPITFFDETGAGKSNIQRPNTFAPNPEKFVLTSINVDYLFPSDAVSAGVIADALAMENTRRIIRQNLQLVIDAAQGVNIAQINLTSIPGGPNDTGFLSTGGVTAAGNGEQAAFPFFYPFERETTSNVGLETWSIETAANRTTSLDCTIEVRFNGIRLRTNNK